MAAGWHSCIQVQVRVILHNIALQRLRWHSCALPCDLIDMAMQSGHQVVPRKLLLHVRKLMRSC